MQIFAAFFLAIVPAAQGEETLAVGFVASLGQVETFSLVPMLQKEIASMRIFLDVGPSAAVPHDKGKLSVREEMRRSVYGAGDLAFGIGGGEGASSLVSSKKFFQLFKLFHK